MDKSRNKEDRVEVQVVDPNLIILKQTLKERINRDSQPSLKYIFEHNYLTRPWVR
jgi:hypothetical protein